MKMAKMGAFTHLTPGSVSAFVLIFGGIAMSLKKAKQRFHDWCIITEK